MFLIVGFFGLFTNARFVSYNLAMKIRWLLLALLGWTLFHKTHSATQSIYFDTVSERYVYLSFLA